MKEQKLDDLSTDELRNKLETMQNQLQKKMKGEAA